MPLLKESTLSSNLLPNWSVQLKSPLLYACAELTSARLLFLYTKGSSLRLRYGSRTAVPLILRLSARSSARADNFLIGGKAHNLSTLMKLRKRVPATWVITSAAFARRLQGDAALDDELRAALGPVLRAGCAYAVRSSANVEDGAQQSFAGQFQSVLGVQGLEDVMRAVERVWASASLPRADIYRAHGESGGEPPQVPCMAVIVQEMVKPVVSGVVFSRNPVSGADEIVIEAVTGSGEALVQDGATPEHWVQRRGRWVEPPAESVLQAGVAEEVAAGAAAVARSWGRPADLEWVWDGRQIWWVQLREITALRDRKVYSNWVAREVLPGQIKPLVWSVNVPLVNSAWVRLFTELIGPNEIDPHDLAKAFHYRAYFNMGEIGRVFTALGMPRSSLELLTGITPATDERLHFRPQPATLRHLPRMVHFAAAKLRFGRTVAAFLPAAKGEAASWRALDAGALDEQALLDAADRLYAFVQKVAYFNIVVPLLMQAYHRAFSNRLAAAGIDVAQAGKLAAAQGAGAYDPNTVLARLHEHFAALSAADQTRLLAQDTTPVEGNASEAVRRFSLELRDFLDHYGHFSDSGNDFSVPPWRETPAIIVQLAAAFQPPAQMGEALPPAATYAARRPLLRRLQQRAAAFMAYREEVSSLYTLAYGQFRVLFLELGRRLAARGLLDAAGDIFYLYLPEVREAVAAGAAAPRLAPAVHLRRADMAACADVSLPAVIYGDEPPPPTADTFGKLIGIATAPGYYRGPARSVTGLADFDSVQPGDVLVIPWSDVGWTPLFARAGAVVAEAGGVLSHSSIIAREYGIPAVVAVTGACRALHGAMVTVDGYRGEIAVHDKGATDGPKGTMA